MVMRVDVRDADRRRVGRIEVDPAARPTRVTIEGVDREVYLTWDRALDDAGQLRRCVACGCGDLFLEKSFPQITGLVVAIAFAGAAIGLLGLANNVLLVVMAVVLVLDVSILVFSRRRLVCYRCRSAYTDLPLARYHRRWERAAADRYPPPATRTTRDEPSEERRP